MRKQEMLNVFEKIEGVKKLHEQKNTLYYNKEALKRDCLRLHRFIDNICTQVMNANKTLPRQWKQTPEEINNENSEERLAEIYSAMCDICDDFKSQIVKLRIP